MSQAYIADDAAEIHTQGLRLKAERFAAQSYWCVCVGRSVTTGTPNEEGRPVCLACYRAVDE